MPCLDPVTNAPRGANSGGKKNRNKNKSIYDEIDFSQAYISPTMSY